LRRVPVKYRGKITGQTMRGNAKLKGPGGKLRAVLTLTLNVSAGDGSGCDAASPSASRILEKPLNVLPHGGAQQILLGSPQEQLITQWADLIAAAACN
jgi:hypothetical protein